MGDIVRWNILYHEEHGTFLLRKGEKGAEVRDFSLLFLIHSSFEPSPSHFRAEGSNDELESILGRQRIPIGQTGRQLWYNEIDKMTEICMTLQDRKVVIDGSRTQRKL